VCAPHLRPGGRRRTGHLKDLLHVGACPSRRLQEQRIDAVGIILAILRGAPATQCAPRHRLAERRAICLAGSPQHGLPRKTPAACPPGRSCSRRSRAPRPRTPRSSGSAPSTTTARLGRTAAVVCATPAQRAVRVVSARVGRAAGPRPHAPHRVRDVVDQQCDGSTTIVHGSQPTELQRARPGPCARRLVSAIGRSTGRRTRHARTFSWPAVSQICSLYACPSTVTVLDTNDALRRAEKYDGAHH